MRLAPDFLYFWIHARVYAGESRGGNDNTSYELDVIVDDVFEQFLAVGLEYCNISQNTSHFTNFILVKFSKKALFL
jgi:hypothetical protein